MVKSTIYWYYISHVIYDMRRSQCNLLWNHQKLDFIKQVNMTDYFSSKGFQQDFNTVIKALLLISKKLEDVTAELAGIKQSLNKENSTDQLVTPPNT
jgi:hypothetical protein